MTARDNQQVFKRKLHPVKRARHYEVFDKLPDQKIISSQTKSVFILTLVKSFSRQSFRQNYFLSEFEWVDLRETAS